MSSVSLPPVHPSTARVSSSRLARTTQQEEGGVSKKSGSSTARRAPTGSSPLSALLQSGSRRRSKWGSGGGVGGFDDDDDDEEKTSPSRQEQVRLRGRYSQAHIASDFGMVFHSSDLGGDYTFNAETADPSSGQHFHRTPITLQSFKPHSINSSLPPRYSSTHNAAAATTTFATEEDATPRDNLQIGSYGSRAPHHSSSSVSLDGGVGAVAEATGKTIWQMWSRMKADRLRAQGEELLREVPTQERASSPFGTHGSSGHHHAPAIDYVQAGKHIASQLQHAGVKVRHNHLDVIHNLAGLERVWLKTSKGLEKDEFVAFLREVLRLPAEELSILFQKMDANCDGSLSWDEYLSYLLIEVTHHWQFRSARGTWHLRDVDSPATPVNAQVQQILVIPRDPNASAATSVNANGRYVFACRDNSIQVWNSATMTYQCHLPPAWRASDLKGGGPSGTAAALNDDPSSAANSAASSSGLSRQTSRIGERQHGGGARQKRCGGGGWRVDTSYNARSNTNSSNASMSATSGAPHAAKGQSAIDEAISRRAAHAGIARLSMAGGVGASESMYSARGGGGLGSYARSSEDDSESGGGAANGEKGGPDGDQFSNPFSRPRQSQGVLHTTVAYYPTQRQLLVAAMDKSIHVYQQTFRQYIQVDRTEVRDTPQSMTVHLNQGGPSSYQSSSQHMTHNADLLIVGDTSGRCAAYTMPVSRDYSTSGGPGGDKSANITVGGVVGGSGGSGGSGGDISGPGGVGLPAGLSSSSITSNLLSSFSTAARPAYQVQVHRVGESVRKVAMLPNVGLVSAGMDAKLHISDLETERVVRSLTGHKRGVYSFAHCESHRCIFSAGFDSRVLVFDPYLPTPTGALAAHHTNILDVVVNERKNQIITTCADKKIKVFDIRTFKCIQSLADSQEYTPYDELTAVTFDQDQQQLVTAGNKIRAWPVAIAPGNKARRGGPAHSNLVVAICFSQVFQQIISVSVDESVHLWDIYTGKSVFEFRTTHGSPLTAACLDHRGKRLITGAHNGTVLMWNFNNGGLLFSFSSLTSLPRRKLAHEFGPRKKEVTSLLYLPRTLQCVVGIGWERSVVRWPDPNAPKNTEWLVQPDHRAEVCSVAYFGSILVTGGSDGEIIVWHMDSARVNKRMDIPKTPRSGKRPGVAKMLFVDFPSGLLLLLAGTDDGSLHFIKVGTSETVFSLFEVYDDPIVGMAANRLDDPDTDVELKFHGARTRLLVADCQAEAKLWDISGITSEQITCVPLLKVWEPHPGGTTTDVIAVDDIQSFMCSSDTGEISVWSTEGEPRAKFAQRKAWPIADPRTSSAGTAEDVATERREAGLSNDQDQATDAEADSDASDESDNDMGTRSSLSTRQASMMSRGSANSSRRGARSRAGITATPPRKELSFAESHPMYVPRDECDKYLKDYAHQSQMESAAAAKEKLAAERERRDERLAAAGGGGGKHAKSGLADMLGKLEADLRHQHERAAHAHHQSGGGGFGGGGNGASSPSHGTTTISGGNGGFTLDATSAIQGAHVYERFHAHHATGASAASSSNATSGLHLHATDSSAATSDANTERTPRPPRVRHVHTTGSAFEERDSDPVSGGAASGSLSARSFSGGRTAAASSSATAGTFLSHRDRARVPLAHGARTISNSDVFVQSGSNRTRQQQQRRLA